jgi:hypothetical protein
MKKKNFFSSEDLHKINQIQKLNKKFHLIKQLINNGRRLFD